MNLLCLDVGSTYTKGAVVDPDSGRLLATSATPTTTQSDVWEGLTGLRDELAVRADHVPGLDDDRHVLVCSSAGGGLKLAVVGFEREVTARAGRMVALSAGASVVFVSSGALTPVELDRLRGAEADLVLLVGGTDGGNATTMLHNATQLARARVSTPVVVAGNREAGQEVQQIMARGGVASSVAENVLPRIGHLSPDSARSAIRAAFLAHVIGGKRLSRHPRFVAAVRRATPDAVLNAVRVLRAVSPQDVMVIDVGGATTDVYSAVEPHGGDAAPEPDAVGSLRVARTVEGDLGLRLSAAGVIGAAAREGLALGDDTQAWALTVASAPTRVADTAAERKADLD
ncbi:MAG: glutamate mutase L, partial [Ornithinimicrobium sp.]